MSEALEGGLYVRESRRRAAHRSEREGIHNTEALKQEKLIQFMKEQQHQSATYPHRSHAVPCTAPAGEHHTPKEFLHEHALTVERLHNKHLLIQGSRFKRLAHLRLPEHIPVFA